MKTLRLLAIFCGLCLLGLQNALPATPPLAGRAYQLADEAYKALEQGQLDRAQRLAADALKLAPKHPQLLLLQADILARQGKHAEAAERVRELSPADLGGQGLAQRGYIWLQAGNRAAAESDFAAAMKTTELNAEQRGNVASELAYLALERKDDEAALRWFQTAIDAPRPGGASKAGLYADAGYAAMRRGSNDVAAQMFSRAIDEWHAAPQGKKPFDEESLFGMRRSVDTISRRWSGTFSIGHSTTGAAVGTGLAGGDLRVVQAGAELAYTPERFGYRNGRLFQLYGNMYQAISSNDETYPTGSDSRIAGIGARYKPLENHNLVLAFERRFALGDRAGDDDWLARVAFSASRQVDWNPTRDAWTTWQAYTEAVYFFDAERWVVPFEARIGRSWKTARLHGAVATAFLGIGGEYDKAQSPRTAAGIGPGIAVRYWFGESRHRAFSRYLDFSLQYRVRMTDATRGEGVFGQVSLSF